MTLLREHCQGPNQMMFVLPTGGFDPSKHADWLACAKAELSEEVGTLLKSTRPCEEEGRDQK